MKKKVFIMLPCIAAVTIATVVGKKTIQSNEDEESVLLMENVEALANPQDVSPQKCTKPKIFGSCYDKEGNWTGTWIDEVEEYEVYPGSPIRFEHFYTHGCPSGSNKG